MAAAECKRIVPSFFRENGYQGAQGKSSWLSQLRDSVGFSPCFLLATALYFVKANPFDGRGK
jgi:hypothetical protein